MHPAWEPFFKSQQELVYFKQLQQFVATQRELYAIYPPANQVFATFSQAPQDVKCVIIGQDPYHQPNQAMGLSFSVPSEQKIPPSLRNIFKELHRSIPNFTANTGNLQGWVTQGVFLLNRVLTVQHAKPNSHAGQGWEIFTKAVIAYLNSYQPVFMLWGKPAVSLIPHISSPHVLQTVHPSPLSAYRGFIGCNHFAQCNAILLQQGKQPINWSV